MLLTSTADVVVVVIVVVVVVVIVVVVVVVLSSPKFNVCLTLSKAFDLIIEIDNTFVAAYLLAAQKTSHIALSYVTGCIVPTINDEVQAVFISTRVAWLSRWPERELPRGAVSPFPDSFLLNIIASKPDMLEAPTC